ncbi:permease-like cell division protein FtsX [Phycicoccus sp. MAQZ13P-2]|uniref:permease-like cell division protein FtsX n=1 Tax=Phycicoccus mangrovi TaxID=2840470 RepID=UPI001C00504C|nr:permease-like cell division protein FtsX [Phycicoccus mangrovi]MBT9255850.1 permease-like cell division protein FtsX [Phycicoccus mangrovi]MBT9274444.1 permease-like cell division protein FtsX [Phycicoccus mangrovi]
MQMRFLASEVGSGLRRNVSMAVSVVLVTMVAMFLLGLGLLAQRQADTMKGYWYDRIQVSIYLCNANALAPNCEGKAATDAQRTALQDQLEALPEVKQVFYESEQQAFQRFKEQFRNSPIAGNVQVGDLPPSLRVQLDDPTKFKNVTTQFEDAPGVATVQDQEKVLSKFFTIINWITVFAVFLAALMAACAALLMATTIRQAAFIRRREIGIMRLVGASNWTIRAPFISEMVIVSAVGVLLAVGLLIGLTQYVFTEGASQIALSQAFIGTSDVWLLAPWMLGGVVLIAVGTSVVTLRRYLRV